MRTPCFSPGDEVCLKGQPDVIGVVVGSPRPITGEWYYSVRFPGHRDTYPQSALELAMQAHSLSELLHRNRWGTRDALVRTLTYTKLREPLRDVIYAFRATRTQYEPYQFKPLIKFLESPNQCLLLADEVGLGKTIEAGYILRELKARAPSFRRVLVVCPATLREKWRDEMYNRFDEKFDILDTAGVRSLLHNAQRYGGGYEFQAVCSLQTLRGQRSRAASSPGQGYDADWEASAQRRPSLLDELEAGLPSIDLLIVDEAHHLRNTGTLSHRLGRVLRDKAEALLFLTAPLTSNTTSGRRLSNGSSYSRMAEYFRASSSRSRISPASV